jgi:hypothetical protein
MQSIKSGANLNRKGSEWSGSWSMSMVFGWNNSSCSFELISCGILFFSHNKIASAGLWQKHLVQLLRAPGFMTRFMHILLLWG